MQYDIVNNKENILAFTCLAEGSIRVALIPPTYTKALGVRRSAWAKRGLCTMRISVYFLFLIVCLVVNNSMDQSVFLSVYLSICLSVQPLYVSYFCVFICLCTLSNVSYVV